MTEYLKITPTTESLETDGILRALGSLHKLTTSTSTSLTEKLNPFHDPCPPRFEFIALSEGLNDPVEFLYGADSHLDTVEKRLRSIYPETFDIERTELDLERCLLQPDEMTPAEFFDRYSNGDLHYEFTEADITPAADRLSSMNGGGANSEITIDGSTVTVDGNSLDLLSANTLSETEPLTNLSKPAVTNRGTILARLGAESRQPMGIRWCGNVDRKRDWMTSLTPISVRNPDADISTVETPGAALATLVDQLTECPVPIAFQVVFQRRENWETDAEVRKTDLEEGRDTFIQSLIGSVFEPASQPDADTTRSLSDSVRTRLELIDAKQPNQTFTVNLRAIAIPKPEQRESLEEHLSTLASVFDPLDGHFYRIEGERLTDRGFRAKTKQKNAVTAFHRLTDRELTTGRGKSRPDLVLSAAELANFILVPSAAQLSVTGVRGTRAEQQSRNPLSSPNPDLLAQFDSGMAIGYPLDENGAAHNEPISIPPSVLPTHYGRFASTGSGKSKAIINDALSLRQETDGPVVIVDPKGDGMCENYLRCHYAAFGDLDDVYEFRLPETLPAFSFFDIRPALAAGRSRADAVQDKVDHFHDILAMIMGHDQYQQAFVANEITSYLIKALFDGEYGSDVFSLNDLFSAALRMQQDRTLPPISAANQNVEESLSRHFAKDDHRFQVSMDAVGNRLDKLREDTHLRRIFNHAPPDPDVEERTPNRFDFRDLLGTDSTVVFDIGNLRPAAQQAVTMLLLSNLWDAVQRRRRDPRDSHDTITNLIIEEAAPIASTRLVSEQLLPKGRSFGLSMGLVMQFPKQVRNRNERAYAEVLNNIKTKLIGNISADRELVESLAHEDLSPEEIRNRLNTLPSGEWIAQLPSPEFAQTGPVPFSLKPLPIAAGHPESTSPLSSAQQAEFSSTVRPQMVSRTQAEYGLSMSADAPTDSTALDWGSARSEMNVDENDGSDSTISNSIFIGSDPPSTAADSENTTILSSSKSTDDTSDEAVSTHSSTESIEPALDSFELPVTDSTQTEHGLSRDDIRFLDHVLAIMNRESEQYTLLDKMTPLRDEFDELDLDHLLAEGYLDEGHACGRKYYTVCKPGRDLLERPLRHGPGLGDLGEKTPHKVGVRLLEQWLSEQPAVDRVEPYYEHGTDTVFDVAGFDSNDELIWVGEAELASNNRESPISDYDKMAAADANAVWAFNARKTAIKVIEWLAEADRLERPVSGRETRTFSSIREAVQELDADGLTTIRSFRNLDQEVGR